MSKQFLQKPRYEYYKGTTEVVDNELDNFVEDVVDRLNEQYFSKRELLRAKQNQDEQIADLQHKLKVAEKALELACKELHCELENPDNELYTKSSDEYIDYFKTKSKEMMKSE